jgi:hypothetical protein
MICSCTTGKPNGEQSFKNMDWSYENNIAVLTNIFSNFESSKLSIDDFNKIEYILKTCMENYNLKQTKIYNDYIQKFPRQKISIYYFILKDITFYNRQYIGILNKNGEKEVWINCFPCGFADTYWRQNVVNISDGGTDFFRLRINLDTGEIFDFIINGHA